MSTRKAIVVSVTARMQQMRTTMEPMRCGVPCLAQRRRSERTKVRKVRPVADNIYQDEFEEISYG
jgi:hypothetical protein